MKIKEARLNKGLSQKDLASALSVPANTLSNWENGKREPDHATLVKLADILNVTTDYLLGRDNDGEIPGEFVVMARKVGGLPPETRKKVFKLLDKNIDSVLAVLAAEEQAGEK